MMGKYADLDNKIIESITEMKAAKFNEILCCLHSSLSFYSENDDEVFRVLDRRLQALRKRGYIAFLNGWRVIKQK